MRHTLGGMLRRLSQPTLRVGREYRVTVCHMLCYNGTASVSAGGVTGVVLDEFLWDHEVSWTFVCVEPVGIAITPSEHFDGTILSVDVVPVHPTLWERFLRWLP